MSGFAPPKPDQPDKPSHRHKLELGGYNEMLAEHCELVDHVATLEQRLGAIEALMDSLGLTQLAADEMLMIGRRLCNTVITGDWQIVRTPTPFDGH